MTQTVNYNEFSVQIKLYNAFDQKDVSGKIRLREGFADYCPWGGAEGAVPQFVVVKKSGDKLVPKKLQLKNLDAVPWFNDPLDYSHEYQDEKEKGIPLYEVILETDVELEGIKISQFASPEFAIQKAEGNIDPDDNFFPGKFNPVKFIREFKAIDEEGDELFVVPEGATGYLHVVKSFEFGRLSRSFIVLVSVSGDEQHLPKLENDGEIYSCVELLDTETEDE